MTLIALKDCKTSDAPGVDVIYSRSLLLCTFASDLISIGGVETEGGRATIASEARNEWFDSFINYGTQKRSTP